MILKLNCISVLFVMAFLSGCASHLPVSQPVETVPQQRLPPRIGWQTTDNLSVSSKNFKLDVLQIFVTPEYIMLICAVSGDLSMGNINIKEVNVLDGQQQPQGQTLITTIREFKQGKLIALTFMGSRKNMPKPLFLINGLLDQRNAVIDEDWHFSPLQLPQGFDDRGGTFMSGVASTQIGTVTIFSNGNDISSIPTCKGNTDIGGPDQEAFFTMVVSEQRKRSCLYTYISKGGNVSELSEEQYLLKLPHP